jgi:hypothetical protein
MEGRPIESEEEASEEEEVRKMDCVRPVIDNVFVDGRRIFYAWINRTFGS